MTYYQGAFGGIVSYDYMRKYSPATLIIIGLNVIIFLVGMLLKIHREIIYLGGMIPLEYIIHYKEYWRLLTSMFIHGNLGHVLFNMIILYHAGAVLEQSLGTKRFLTLYFASGLLVSLCTGLLSTGISIGASGALFALLGYLLFYEIRARKMGFRTNNIVLPLVVLNIITTLITPNISKVGHFSGLIIGYLIPWIKANILKQRFFE